MKALETSARSLDEILSFINTTIEDAKGCEDWGGSLSGYTLGDFFQEVHKIFSVFSGCIKINLFSYASLLPEFLTIVSSPFLQEVYTSRASVPALRHLPHSLEASGIPA